MPVRGENIGTAVVNLFIKGDKVHRNVEEALESADGAFDDVGEEQGKRYAKGVKRGINKEGVRQEDLRNFTDGLNKRLTGIAAITGEKSGNSFFGAFRKSVRKQLGEGKVADLFIQNFEREFAQAGGTFNFTKLFDKQGKILASADATKEWARRINEVNAELVKQDKLLEKDTSSFISRFGKLGSESRRVLTGMTRDFEDLKFAIGNTALEVDTFRTELRKLGDRGGLSAEQIKEFTREIDAMDRALKSARPAIIRYRVQTDRFSTILGRALGRGSRSELINFFAVLTERGVRGFFRLGGAVLRSGIALRSFASAMSEAGGSLTGFARLSTQASAAVKALGARLGPALATLANPAGIAAVVAGVVALSLAFGALASTISAVVGVLVALIATLVGSLVGALGIAAGALAPLVAGIGVTVAAFKSLDDASKQALKDSLKPLTDQFRELGRLAAGNIFGSLEKSVDSLVKAFDTPAVTQFVDQISIAVGKVIEQFARAAEGPEFQRFLEILSNTMPEQITNLGFAAQQFGAGFGGILLALQPSVTALTEGLANMAARFNAFVNSEAGQTRLIEFFDKASRGARAVGGLVKDIGVALIVLFEGRAGTIGIEIFEKIRKKVQQFIDFLKDPKNKDKIDTFFDEAEETVSLLLSIFNKFKNAFLTFTAKENQDDLQAILTTVDKIAGVFEKIADLLSNISISKTLKNLISFVPGLNSLGFLAHGVRNFGGGLAVVGEEGPELVNLPRGSDVFSNSESRHILSSSSNSSVVVNQNFFGPQTGADRKREIDWAIRSSGYFGPATSAVA